MRHGSWLPIKPWARPRLLLPFFLLLLTLAKQTNTQRFPQPSPEDLAMLLDKDVDVQPRHPMSGQASAPLSQDRPARPTATTLAPTLQDRTARRTATTQPPSTTHGKPEHERAWADQPLDDDLQWLACVLAGCVLLALAGLVHVHRRHAPKAVPSWPAETVTAVEEAQAMLSQGRDELDHTSAATATALLTRLEGLLASVLAPELEHLLRHCAEGIRRQRSVALGGRIGLMLSEPDITAKRLQLDALVSLLRPDDAEFTLLSDMQTQLRHAETDAQELAASVAAAIRAHSHSELQCVLLDARARKPNALPLPLDDVLDHIDTFELEDKMRRGLKALTGPMAPPATAPPTATYETETADPIACENSGDLAATRERPSSVEPNDLLSTPGFTSDLLDRVVDELMAKSQGTLSRDQATLKAADVATTILVSANQTNASRKLSLEEFQRRQEESRRQLAERIRQDRVNAETAERNEVRRLAHENEASLRSHQAALEQIRLRLQQQAENLKQTLRIETEALNAHEWLSALSVLKLQLAMVSALFVIELGARFVAWEQCETMEEPAIPAASIFSSFMPNWSSLLWQPATLRTMIWCYLGGSFRLLARYALGVLVVVAYCGATYLGAPGLGVFLALSAALFFVQDQIRALWTNPLLMGVLLVPMAGTLVLSWLARSATDRAFACMCSQVDQHGLRAPSRHTYLEWHFRGWPVRQGAFYVVSAVLLFLQFQATYHVAHNLLILSNAA